MVRAKLGSGDRECPIEGLPGLLELALIHLELPDAA